MKDGLSILNVTWAWPQGSVDWWQVKCLRLWRGPRGRFRPASPALGDHKRLMPWLQNRWVVHFPLCSAKPPESKKKRPLRDYVLLYRHAKLLLYVANDWWSQYLHKKYNTYSLVWNLFHKRCNIKIWAAVPIKTCLYLVPDKMWSSWRE